MPATGPRPTSFAQVKRCYVGEMASAPVDALGPSTRPLVFGELSGPGPTRARVQAGPARPVPRRSTQADGGPRPGRVGKVDAVGRLACATDESRRFAWLALDHADNDPVRFWTYVIEALRTQQAPNADATPWPR